MPSAAHLIALPAAVINLLAAAAMLLYTVRALLALRHPAGIDQARLTLAEGVLAVLGFSLAASLLNLLALQQWPEIRAFATVFVIRTGLKQMFNREKRLISSRAVS